MKDSLFHGSNNLLKADKEGNVWLEPRVRDSYKFGKDIKGISNITGGGFYENIPRVLPEGVRASIDVSKIPQMPIFEILEKKGDIPIRDMYNTFNMGIGMAITVSEGVADSVVSALRDTGESPLVIGHCTSGDKGVDLIW